MSDWENWLELKEVVAEIIIRLDKIVELLEILVGNDYSMEGIRKDCRMLYYGNTIEELCG